MASLDSRVITPHISVKPCNDIYPKLVRSVSSGWISVSTHVIQVAAPKKMRISSSYRTIEKVTTLYTQEELQQWEDYMQLPFFQHSQHQRLLNELCTGDSCSYGSRSPLSELDLEVLRQHIKDGSEQVLASINPFGVIIREIEYMKTFLNTILLLEYSILTISLVTSILLYRVTATLGALITRLTLNWARLKIYRVIYCHESQAKVS